MPTVIKEIRLICVDLDRNSNKFWTGKLFDDDSIITYWGRVSDDTPQSKISPKRGARGLESLAQDKMKVRPNKPPYVELKTVQSGAVVAPASVQEVAAVELERLALNQIKTNRPELRNLIGRLVRSNIHKISSVTNGAVTFNVTTGLFQTPLGIVTPSGIAEARDILGEIMNELGRDGDVSGKLVNQYLCIVPQNIGRARVTPASIFPDNAAVQKQSDILDSLESSYKAIQGATPNASQSNAEQLFSLDLDQIESNHADYIRLNRWYEDTKDTNHNYDNVRVKNVYKVNMRGQTYEDKLGNDEEVFHGTSEANLLSILKSGLRVTPPSTAHIAGDNFGAGVYGAKKSTKSLGYSKGRWGGSSGGSAWLFICDFAMGKTHEVSVWSCSRPSGFDSIWAKAMNASTSSWGRRLYNDELIVARETQVRIKYLLECQ